MNAANHSTIKICNQTQNSFWVFHENHFLVLPDGKTVVGADGSDKKKLLFEDITQGNPRQIGTHDDWIRTVLFHSLSQSLLVGDDKGHVKQYKKVNQSFMMVKDYGNVGVDSVFSSIQIDRFAIFGGDKRSLVAIDISEQQVCSGRMKSPFAWTYSLQVCEGVGSKMYLSLGGNIPHYFSDTSDLLDVTLLYNSQKKDSPKNTEKINQAHTALKEKDEIIYALSLKISQLESSLQKQVNQNQGIDNIRPPKPKQVTQAEDPDSLYRPSNIQEQNPESWVQ